MNENKRSVILTGMTPEIAGRYEPTLLEAGFDVVIEDEPDRVPSLVQERFYQAVVSYYPLETGALGEILSALRVKDGLSHGTSLVLIARRDRVRAAAGLVGRGVNKALSVEEAPAVLRIVLERLIEVAQPMALRLPIAVDVSAIAGRELFDWKTENLSGGGMLIETDDPLDVGTTFRFILMLDEGDVEGEAAVVRHTSAGREAVDGFGVRFLSFRNDGQAALLRYLRRIADEE